MIHLTPELIAGILERSRKTAALPSVTTAYMPPARTEPVPRPALHYPVLEQLFDIGYALPAGFLEAVQQLPANTLAVDLASLIRYFIDDYPAYREDEGRDTWGLIHAFLLGGLALRPELREAMLLAFSQPEEVIDFYFGDTIFEGLWWSIFQHLPEAPDAFFDFLKKPGIAGSAKVAVLQAVQYLYAARPELRELLMTRLQELAEQYLLRRDEAGFADYVVASELALALIEHGNEAQLQTARYLFEAGLVDEGVAGPYERVVADRGRYDRYSRGPVPGLAESYHHLLRMFGPRPEPAGNLGGPLPRLMSGSAPAGAGHKVGRNDLCPCGSGKKYKKCCMNK